MAASSQATPQIGRLRLTPAVRLGLMLLQISIIVVIGYFAPPWIYWPMWLSAAGWIAFSSYWARAARDSAEAKDRESTKSRRVHEILMNGGLLLLFIPVPGLTVRFLPASMAWVLAGLAMQAMCVALAVWARRHLGRYWSMRVEIKVEHKLIQSGPYRLLRHPIYSAMVGMYVATALVSGQWHAVGGVALVLVAYWRKIRMEEAKLNEAFGADYEKYRRSSWALIPGLF